MAKVTGIGGIFVTSRRHKETADWYRDVLGIPLDDNYGWDFRWKTDQEGDGRTVFGLFEGPADYFAPSERDFMLNFRVDDLDGFLAILAGKGVEPVGDIQEYPYGRFAWILDPEGTKLELWETKQGEDSAPPNA